ncbi:hypothetical protein H0H93_003169 [Arthromyces matolae]|nr:hypothetical protein H0H93_003169 [Arthromyces matolae]
MVHQFLFKFIITTSFGEERPYTHRLHTRQIRRIKKLATFTFKYRSIGTNSVTTTCHEVLTIPTLDILKADGIAPSDPVPQGNRGKRKASEIPEIEEDLDSRTDEEDSAMYKGLVDALQALEEKRAKRKARKAVPGASKKIKKEHTTHTLEVIDLT